MADHNSGAKKLKTGKTLSEHESKKLLAGYGIPVTREQVVASENDAAAAARKIGYPVALKGSGKALIHKTEMNLVALDLRSGREVRNAYRQLISSKVKVTKVLVQQMVKGDREIVAGMVRDPQFGPCVMFGIGGILTEISGDIAFRIAPLTRKDALDMMEEIRGSKILDAFRGKPPVDQDALADILIALGNIALENESVSEVDINPLKFINGDPVAVDALVVMDDSLPQKDNRISFDTPFGEGFPPKSIGVVGVSREGATAVPGYSGIRIFRLLTQNGFKGRVYPINPKANEIDGVTAYPDVISVPEQLDLVIITVSAPIVPRVLEDCVAAKVRNVHICSSGFGETGTAEGKQLEKRIKDIAVRGRLRIIGPNCMGFHVPSANIKMFDEIKEFDAGPVAFLSQSGGHAQTYLFQSRAHDIGFSKIISYGNALILDADHFLEYLGTDPETRIICVYIESVGNARAFLKQVKTICPEKPLILLKGGVTESGARAAASHTGAMAGDKKIWNAFFRQTGAIQVHSLEEMAETTYCFLKMAPISRIQAAVLGLGGGASVSNGDICVQEGIVIPALSEKTIAGLAEFIPLTNQGIANPMDVPAMIFNYEGLEKMLDKLNADPEIDVIILNVPSRIIVHEPGDLLAMLKMNLNRYARDHSDAKPIVVATSEAVYLSWTETCVHELREAGIITFPSLPGACRALRRFADYHRFFDKRKTSQ